MHSPTRLACPAGSTLQSYREGGSARMIPIARSLDLRRDGHVCAACEDHLVACAGACGSPRLLVSPTPSRNFTPHDEHRAYRRAFMVMSEIVGA